MTITAIRGSRLLIGCAIGSFIIAIFWVMGNSASQRVWNLQTGHKLVISQYTNQTDYAGLNLSGMNLNLQVKQIALPNGEHVDLSNIRPLEPNNKLVGILMRPRVIWTAPQAGGDSMLSLPMAVLSQTLVCVINAENGSVWKAAPGNTQILNDDLRAQFVNAVVSDKSKWPDLYAGIDYVDVDGKNATIDDIAGLDKFGDLTALSVSEGRPTIEFIDAISLLPNIRKLWLDYTDFDKDSLRALARLNKLDFIRLRDADVKNVSGSEAILNSIREALPNTKVLVVPKESD
jgi:hypothetical protein